MDPVFRVFQSPDSLKDLFFVFVVFFKILSDCASPAAVSAKQPKALNLRRCGRVVVLEMTTEASPANKEVRFPTTSALIKPGQSQITM